MRREKKTMRHEAFGVIRLHRMQSSGTRLFRSPVRSTAYMEIEICTGEVETDDHGDRVWGRESLLTVALSAVQFAELLTSANLGDGIPCTITRRAGKLVAAPPEETGVFDVPIECALASYDEGPERIRKAISMIEADLGRGGVKKRTATEVLCELDVAITRITVDRAFWRDQLVERAADLRTRVLGEVAAAAELFVRRIGLDALADRARGLLPVVDEPPPKEIEG